MLSDTLAKFVFSIELISIRPHADVPKPGVAAFIAFAAQVEFVQFKSARKSPPPTHSLSVLIHVVWGRFKKLPVYMMSLLFFLKAWRLELKAKVTLE